MASRSIPNTAEWRWSDLDRPRNKWAIFALSGEFVTTFILWMYTFVLLWPGSSLTQTPAFRWLVELSDGRDWPWAAVAFGLSIIAPLAVWFDDGRVRLLSMFMQGCFFVLLAGSGFVNFPLSLGWATFAALGSWLIGRAIDFVTPHAVLLWRDIVGFYRAVRGW